MATRLGRYVRGRTHFPYCPRYTGFNRVLYHGGRVRNQVLRISANVGCGNVAARVWTSITTISRMFA